MASRINNVTATLTAASLNVQIREAAREAIVYAGRKIVAVIDLADRHAEQVARRVVAEVAYR